MKNGFNVRFNYDLKDFEKNAKKCAEDIQNETEPILKKSVKVFANAAAKATWPDKGKSSIRNTLYFRPVLSLKKLIAGEYAKYPASEIDKGQLKRGMRYKVVNTKKGKRGQAYAYTKTLAEAKALSRIETRGLNRVMWGKSVTDIGVDVPLGIQNLIKKSPKLGSLPYSKTTFGKEQDSQYVEVTNSATGIESAGKDGVKAGDKAVARELQWRLKAIANKERNI